MTASRMAPLLRRLLWVGVAAVGVRPRCGRLRAVEEDGHLVGRTVGEIAGAVLALRRADGAVTAAPAGDTVQWAGDVVLVLADRGQSPRIFAF